jgi:pantetheine-phosphate adenylyltransferase
MISLTDEFTHRKKPVVCPDIVRQVYGVRSRTSRMNPSDRTAILGGTFTPIHNGHRALLNKAFQTASHDGGGDGYVIVGLTATSLAKQSRSDPSHAEQLGTFRERRGKLDSELNRMYYAYSAAYEIIELTDTHGPAATREDVNALVVSPEAKAQRRAHELNQQRVENDLQPLEIHTPPFVIAEDGSRISSTRIRNGEIDAHGRLLD